MIDGWRRFARVGTVSAQRLDTQMSWTTGGGDALVGRPGDWRVTDGERVWTVAAEEFDRSYVAVEGGFRRRGVVRARLGRPGEVVCTLEGDATVAAGDWVVEGEGGERWPVPAERFAQAYEPAD